MSEPGVTISAFFAGVSDGRLTAIRCASCGELAIPPKEFCPACGRHDWRPTTLGGRGTVASFTVIRVAPRASATEAPYAIAAVRLEEGVCLLGRLVNASLESIHVGMKVRFHPIVRDGSAIIGFVPA